MALKLVDVVEEMKKVVADDSGVAPHLQCAAVLKLAADFLLKALARHPDKDLVAFLFLSPDRDQLAFAHPRHLASGNTLPVDRESIAGRVALDGKTAVENNVPEEPHKAFFELIPDTEGTVRSIQKMVAAPLLAAGGTPFGVVEVSRTGSSLADAGPDFTFRDADNLDKCCRAFAPFIARTRDEVGRPTPASSH